MVIDPVYKTGAPLCLYIFSVLYIIILAAALDLVPPSTPKGIVLFFDITPALVAKLVWPYLSRGKIRYAKRLIGCCLMTWCGMIVSLFQIFYSPYNSHDERLSPHSTVWQCDCLVYALHPSHQVCGEIERSPCIIQVRKLGLGELTFLQLSTTYAPASVAGHSIRSVLQRTYIGIASLNAFPIQLLCIGHWSSGACWRVYMVGGPKFGSPARGWVIFGLFPRFYITCHNN